jgi:hypothetical protein
MPGNDDASRSKGVHGTTVWLAREGARKNTHERLKAV